MDTTAATPPKSSPSPWLTLVQGSRALPLRPWPNVEVTPVTWVALAERLAVGEFTLLGLWGDGESVRMALLAEAAGGGPFGTGPAWGVVTLPCPDRRFPSLARWHPPAQRLERTLAELGGLVPEGALDQRPWLDHGRWPIVEPLGNARPRLEPASAPYRFLPVEGESLHQIPVGPVHAGIIEPGHFRFTAIGETVVRLEERLGYVHKGVERLMIGLPLDRAARIAGRISGDSAVAYGIAFARAAEAALAAPVPARAHWLRALMAELERIANHLGDFGMICNDAAFALVHAQAAVLREKVARTASACFGHRLMFDRAVPGGVAADLSHEGSALLRHLVPELRDALAPLVEIYDGTPSLQDRTLETGFLKPELARRFGAGGPVGRACGRGFDARKTPGYPPYDSLSFEVPTETGGDVHARVMVRLREIDQSLGLIEQLLAGLPGGPIRAELPLPGEGESADGIGLVEGFRGDILLALRLGPGGVVERCHPRDPSWFQWPLLEAVIEGNIVADFPLCNKSFNCSYSGHDL